MKELYYKKVAGSTFTDYTYDKNGNLITAYAAAASETSTLSVVKTETVNGAGLTTETRDESASSENDSDIITNYGYDHLGRKQKENFGSGYAEYTYVGDSEKVSSRKVYDGNTLEHEATYSYDSKGRVTKISTGAGTVREYSYDGLGRVSVIKDFDGPGSSTYIHKAFSYDSVGRTSSIVCRDNGSSGNILESFTYEYDKNSNITKVTHINNLLSEAVNETRDYSYDQHGRLIQSVKTDKTDSSTVTTDYTYDDAGNRLTETVNGVMTEYTYNELNQLTGQVSDTSETLYLYDERGNQIHAETINEDESVSTVDMEYSVMGEMTSRTEKSGTNTTLAQTNVYDQDGQRIKRTQNETTRNYYYDSGVVLYTKDGGTVSSANILSDSGAAIGTYRGNTYHTYLKDAQGSTTNLVRSDGTLTAAYDYTDFGETTELAGASFDNQIRYTGSIYDEETGLYYLNARYYDPETGRFISQDSYRGHIQDSNQWHLYVYCANNPVNYSDPSGHIALPIYMFGVLIFTVGACTYTSTAQFQEDWQEAADDVAAKYKNNHRDTKKAWRLLFSAILESFAKATTVYTTNEKHHIVAKTAKKAKLARKIYVTRTDHDIDDERNLVPLKKGLHKRLHRKKYFEMVNVALSKAYYKESGYKKRVNNVDRAVKKIRDCLNIMNKAAPF